MLDGYRKLFSEDTEETKKFLAARDMALLASAAAQGEALPFRAEINIFETDGFRLAYVRTESELYVDFSEDLHRYRMLVPREGEMYVRLKGETTMCTRNRTTVVSPGQPHQMWTETGGTVLFLSFSVSAVRKRFAAMTGAPAMEDIQFEPDLDLTRGAGLMVSQAVNLIVGEIDAGTVTQSDPWRLSHFEETVLSSLLLYHPHSHHEQFQHQRNTPASKDVRRVIEYVDSHLDAEIRLEDLVRVSGVSQSSLNKNFRAFTGVSPVAYLRKARLIAVRQALMEGAVDSVTGCAMKYGFTHMGRFSSAYTKAFGETPSKTLSIGRR